MAEEQQQQSQSPQEGSSPDIQQMLRQQIAEAVQSNLSDLQQQIANRVEQEMASVSQPNGYSEPQDQSQEDVSLVERASIDDALQKVTDTASSLYAWIREMVQRIADFIRTTLRDLAITATQKAIRAALAPVLRMIVRTLKNWGAQRLESLLQNFQPQSGQQEQARPA